MSAQVAIASEYFPAYARVPRKVQRKANEFIRKFQQDPKQASIHYEPIGNVVDKQLRSVRVGDDYRAIVRAPEQGNTFILLYIDHHDEAYRWAEGKQIQVHPSTGTLQFFDVDRASAAVSSLASTPAQDPRGEDIAYEERRLFSDYTDQQLFVGGVPKVLIPAVRALFTDADLDKLVEHLPREAADLLTGLASGYEYDSVLQSILDTPPAKTPTAPPPPASEKLERVRPTPARLPSEPSPLSEIEVALQKESTQAQFRLIDESFDLDKALSHPLDAWRVYLHPTQRKIVRARTKGPLRITGGAGTGKTVVAMHRAAWLLKSVFTAPDDKVLVTTFTKNLAHDIRNNLEKLLEPEDLARVDVTNIDAWASDYLKSQGQSLRPATRGQQDDAWKNAFDLYGVDGYDMSFCRAEWDAVIQAQGIDDENTYVRAVRHHRGIPLARSERRKLWELFSEYRNSLNASGVAENVDIIRAARTRLEAQVDAAPKYCSVIVDETQDLSNEALRLVRTICGPERPNDLLLVGDAHQRIYGRPAPLSQCGINIRGRRSHKLRLNYRTTAAICRWSLRTLGTGEYDDLDGGLSTTNGYVSLRKGAAPNVQHFANKAAERSFVVEKVQALLKSGILPEEICIVARTKNLLSGGYAPAFDQAGIPYEILEQKEPRSSSVRFATMHRVKGLEFPIVFVGAVNDDIVPLSTKDLKSEDPLVAARAEQQERCLLYVATSRARDQLFVTSYETKSPFLEGLDAPPAEPESKRDQLPAPTLPRAEMPAQKAVPEGSPPAAPQTSAFVDTTPLSAWRLPTRMANWLERNGVHTVGDLVSLSPTALVQEKNLGRKSIRDTGEIIRAKLGASWEELGGGLTVGALGEIPEAVSPDVTAGLERPLADLELPVRFFTWANQHNIVTLRDLAAKHPLDLYEARNMGRETVSQTRSVLESALGRRWEEIHRQLASGSHTDLVTGWDTLKAELEAEVVSRSLAEVPLPKAMREYAEKGNIGTVEALVALAEEKLLAESVNPGVISVSANALRNYSAMLSERLRSWRQGFLPALKEMFVELDTIPRMIVTRRAGLGLPPETLEEIGATLGVTRERVRQIEKKTWDEIQRSTAWCGFVESNCLKVAPNGAVSLESLEEDTWWSALAAEPDALDYFCDRLLDGRWRVIKLESQRFLAAIPQKDFDAARIAAKRAAKEFKYPVPYAVARAQVLAATGETQPAVSDIIWQEVEEQLGSDGAGATRRATAYGSTRHAQLIAYLEQQTAPVSVNEAFAVTGRMGALPDEVFMLSRGVVGLERHFPDFQEWKKRLVPVVIKLIEENGPERQWSCTDLIPPLREEVNLPEWLEHWHLSAILRRCDGIEYLGRLRVALPGVIEDSTRILVHEAAQELLSNAGVPMSWDDLTKQLRSKLDVSDIALVGILNKTPFIKVAKRSYGLVTRDLPGGLEAMVEALDELEAVLERRQRGLASKFVHKEVAKLSAIHSEWTEEMCLSVVRGDPRFRNAFAGLGVGLSEWETVRIPTRFDIVQEAVAISTGRVSLEAIAARVEAVHGTAPSRIQIGVLANRLGGRLDGDSVVLEAET